MDALEFRHELARYLLSRGVYALAPRLWSARLAPLHLVRRAPPTATRPGWLRVRVTLSGICGSDLNLVTGHDSLALEPEATYPFVPGHELVARVETLPSPRAPPPRLELTPGQRVAVCPVLGCRARGHEPCASCAAGWDGLCTRRHEGWPGPGLAVGFNHDTGGGWAEACLLHESQVWPLSDAVTDEDAVLLDAAAAPLAALLRAQHPRPSRTLVIGGGTIGLLCGYLDRALGLSDEREVLVRHEFQRAWAERRGVGAAVVEDEAAFRAWAADRRIPARRVVGYGYVYRGIYDRVVVTAGSQVALRWALATVRPRGTVVLVAAPPTLRGLDPTTLWYREISLRGIYQYGPVPWQGESLHPYAVLLPKLADGTLSFRDLVTHRFALEDYPAALRAVARRGPTGAIKVVFRPGSVPR